MERRSGKQVSFLFHNFHIFKHDRFHFLPLGGNAKGGNFCHHSSIPHSTHRKLIDSVISVDTLRATGATGKVFFILHSTSPSMELTRTGPYDCRVIFRLSWTAKWRGRNTAVRGWSGLGVS